MISRVMEQNIQLGGGIRDAFNEARRQKELYGVDQVFDLSIGNPSAPPPEKVMDVMRELSEKEDLSHHYMCEAGYEFVREKIADHLNGIHGTAYDLEQIVMTNGVAGGINLVLRALVDPEDEVLIFKPYYPAYVGFIKNWTEHVVMAGAVGMDFQPDLEEFEQKLSSRTKVVIINSPHNPSGTIYTEETAAKMTEILRKKEQEYGHPIYLLSDEPYRDLVYDGTRLPWWPDYFRNTIVSYSFSKSLSLAGERIGYLLIPSQVEDWTLVTKAIRLSIGRLGFVNAPAFFQQVIGECVEETVDLEYYDRNRRLLYEGVKSFGFTCVEPRGAFYIFLKAPKGDEKGFLQLARKRHLIFVGGSAFGWEGYVRLSFCGGYEMLKRALPALALLAKDCKEYYGEL